MSFIHVQLYSWLATTWQGGHVGGQYNIIFSRRIYSKIGFSSQRREMFLFLTPTHHQHGRREVMCKPVRKKPRSAKAPAEKGIKPEGKNMINIHSCILNIGKCGVLQHAKYGLERYYVNPVFALPEPSIKSWVADKAQIYYWCWEKKIKDLVCHSKLHPKAFETAQNL